jgi:hypothetical protein
MNTNMFLAQICQPTMGEPWWAFRFAAGHILRILLFLKPTRN